MWECDFFLWFMFYSGYWVGVYFFGIVRYINKDFFFIIFWIKKKKKMYLVIEKFSYF